MTEFWAGFATGGLIGIGVGFALCLSIMVLAAVMREKEERRQGGPP